MNRQPIAQESDKGALCTKIEGVRHQPRKLWLLVSLCVFCVSLFVFWWNAAPSVTFHDSGEFAMAAASAGIPHPPGAPTWTALASAFVRIGGFKDPARGTNLFSGLCAAFTLAMLCGLSPELGYDLDPERLLTDSFQIQPGHLQARIGAELDPGQRDASRARLLRDSLGLKGKG